MPNQTKTHHRILHRMPLLAISTALASLTREGWATWIFAGALLFGLSVLGVLAAALFVPQDYPHARLLALARMIRSARTTQHLQHSTSPATTTTRSSDSTAFR